MKKRNYKPQDAKKMFFENSKRILITRTDEPFGFKLYKILKRSHEVLGLQSDLTNRQFSTLDITKTDSLTYFIQLEEPDIVIHLEKGLSDETSDVDFALAVQIGNICSEQKIRFVWVTSDLKELNDEQKSTWLILLVSMVFGFNFFSERHNLMIKLLTLINQDKKAIYDDVQEIFPVLMDEAALCIQGLLEREGTFLLAGERTTVYQWAMKAAVAFKWDSTLLEPKNDAAGRRKEWNELVPAFNFGGIEQSFQVIHDQMACIFKLIYEYAPQDTIMGMNVGNFRYELGLLLGSTMDLEVVKRLDCVVPVPKTGKLFAMGLAQKLHIPYVEALVKDTNLVRSFDIQNVELRKEIVRTRIAPLSELLEGRSIALVDEAIFTGTTLKVVCGMLHECNVKEIHICIPTPRCRGSCEQYIMPERLMLLEYISEGMLLDYFGVDSITFQSDDMFKTYTSRLGDSCMKCFFAESDNE